MNIILIINSKPFFRKHPINIILLGVFTIFESFLIGIISSQYKTSTLLIAVGITCIVVIGITIFAFQTKYDVLKTFIFFLKEKINIFS